jgi:hypothetical protein
MNVKGGAKAKKADSRSPPKEDVGVKSLVPPLLRNKDKDNVDCKRTDDPVRNNCIGLMYNGLCYSSEECEYPTTLTTYRDPNPPGYASSIAGPQARY